MPMLLVELTTFALLMLVSHRGGLDLWSGCCEQQRASLVASLTGSFAMYQNTYGMFYTGCLCISKYATGAVFMRRA